MAYVRLVTIDAISCPICMSSNAEIFLPKILRCHHILCLPCLLTYYVDCKQSCPLCSRSICLSEVRRIEISAHAVEPGDTIDLVLLTKDAKTFRVEYYRPSVAREESFDDFLSNVRPASAPKLEALFLADLQSLYAEPTMQELDPLILGFCEFLQLRALQRVSEPQKTSPQLGRKPVKPQQTGKDTRLYYLYQITAGYAAFLHPLDAEYLLREARYDFDNLRAVLLVS